jgi:hypothetical protein
MLMKVMMVVVVMVLMVKKMVTEGTCDVKLRTRHP